MKRFIVFAFSLLAIFVASPVVAAEANVDDFTFTSVTSDVVLGKTADGHSQIEVIDTYVALFPNYDQNKGLVVSYPKTWNESKYDINFNLVSVTDEAGNPVFWEVASSDDNEVVYYLDDETFKRGPQTYVIEWTAEDVVGFFEGSETEEFYWNVITNQRNQIAWESQATVTVDESLTSALTGDVGCYVGREYSTTLCTYEQTGNQIVFATGELGSREGATVAVGFTPDTFVTPVEDKPLLSIWVLIGLGLALLTVPHLLGAILFRVHRKKIESQHPASRLPVIAQYSPMKGSSVTEGAVLLGGAGKTPSFSNSLLKKIVSAETVQLVVDESAELAAANSGFVVQAKGYQDKGSESSQLFYNHLFPNGITHVPAESMHYPQNVVAAANNKIFKQDYMVELLWSKAQKLVLLSSLGSLLILCLLSYLSEAVTVAEIVSLGWLVTSVFYAMSFRKRYIYTQKGLETENYLKGLELYIDVAEEERIQFLQSVTGAERRIDTSNSKEIVDLYEKLLPWAILFGKEKTWRQVIKQRVETLPDYDRLRYSDRYRYLVYTPAKIKQYVPPSSSSSSGSTRSSGGSRGGGHSGGGGGGGRTGGR